MDLRRQILDTARSLLIGQGYSGLSLRRIASQIGCSATAIYLYFDNRDALVHSLIDEGFDMLYQRVLAASLSEQGRSVAGIGRLRRIAWEYIAFGLDNPEYYEVMFMLNSKDLARYPTEKYRRASRSMEPFIDELRRGIARGELREVDPRRFASIVWASMHGGVAIVLARRLDVRTNRQRFLYDLLDNALRGLIPPGDAADRVAVPRKPADGEPIDMPGL
jgi:AcrR family transcriptional regulator